MDTTVLAQASAREADWRFLLPQPDAGMFDHMLLAGGSPELGAHVAGLGLARRVSRGVRGGPAADVVVVLSDADVSLDELAPHIADSACLYIEVDRRAPGRRLLTPRRLRRTLEAHGFDTTGAYWVKPGFPRRDTYLPFGSSGALRWYLDTVYRASSPARRALKAVLRGLAHRDAVFAAVVPCYAITAVRGTSPRRPALVEHTCATHAATMQPVMLAAGEADWNRLVFVLFDHNASHPSAVVKRPRTATFNGVVEREHSVLRDVSAMLRPSLHSTIPSSMLVRIGDVSVTAETCVRGTALAATSAAGARGACDDLHAAADWLTTFHRETTGGHVPADEWVEQELIGRVCQDYRAAFGVTAAEQRLFDAALESVGRDTRDLPIVWQHADFGPWNIYRDGRHVSVIDWERARRGPALADLLYFVLHWSAALHRCATREQRVGHFESLFCASMSRHATGPAIDAQLRAYMHAVGVAPALLPHVLVYTVLESAVRRARLLAGTARALLRDSAVNEYIGYVDILARHHDRLFAQAGSRGLSCATG